MRHDLVHRLLCLAATAVLGCAVQQAAGDVIAFDNMGPSNAFDTGSSEFVSDEFMNPWRRMPYFAAQVTEPGVLSRIVLPMRRHQDIGWGPEPRFRVMVRADDNGQPGDLLGLRGVVLYDTTPTLVTFDMKSRNIQLQQGNRYWIGLAVDSEYNAGRWFHEATGVLGDRVDSFDGGWHLYQGVRVGAMRIYVDQGGGTCPPDLNGDGVVDADDFFLFLALFADGDPRADINGDGIIDADDFFEFLAAFAVGC